MIQLTSIYIETKFKENITGLKTIRISKKKSFLVNLELLVLL